MMIARPSRASLLEFDEGHPIVPAARIHVLVCQTSGGICVPRAGMATLPCDPLCQISSKWYGLNMFSCLPLPINAHR